MALDGLFLDIISRLADLFIVPHLNEIIENKELNDRLKKNIGEYLNHVQKEKRDYTKLEDYDFKGLNDYINNNFLKDFYNSFNLRNGFKNEGMDSITKKAFNAAGANTPLSKEKVKKGN